MQSANNKSARSVLKDLHPPGVPDTPLVDLHDGVGEIPNDSIETERLIRRLSRGNGEVVINVHHEEKKEERWIRYIPGRDIYELKTYHKRTGEENEYLVRHVGEASIWLINCENLTLLRPESVLVEFGDPTRMIKPNHPRPDPEKHETQTRPPAMQSEYDTAYDLTN